MKTSQNISTRSGMDVVVETTIEGPHLKVDLRGSPKTRCLLHWGLRTGHEEAWSVPPESLWPPGTQTVGRNAVQSPFARENGQTHLVIRLPQPCPYVSLDFVLFFPDEGRWDSNDGRDYRVNLAETGPHPPGPLAALRARVGSAEICFERVFDLPGQGQLAVAVSKAEARYRVSTVASVPGPGPLLLHWGIARRSPHEWLAPPPALVGLGTMVAEQRAAQSSFSQADNLNVLDLEFPEAEAPLGLQFVLRQQAEGGRWINHRGGNFYVPVQPPKPGLGAAEVGAPAALADEIIRAEGHSSWTLMHRFNLCHDLLDQARDDSEKLALLYVWLRFSAIRQLTWQRNYNTKPRELAHAQDRLTQKLAGLYRAKPPGWQLLRLMLTTVGRGGEGQRIRDEILNIMHRHHVKEVSGHFLEEWHQKLHNNTTPDDVVICEAYLAFLRSNGSAKQFYEVLEAGGVTKERLESFERPIRSQPDFVPHLKDGLLHDFREFLKLLKAAHSGTDFDTAFSAARGRLEGGLQGLLDWVALHRNDGPEGLVQLVNQTSEARRQLSHELHQSEGVRELLYLDLALEQLLRGIIERNIHLHLAAEVLADLITRVLENVTLSNEDQELAACCRHWERLQSLPRFGADWSLHAKAVTDRMARALGAWIDRCYQVLQPKAEQLGHGFKAEAWTITLFSEGVVRGSSLGFALSMLLHQLDPLLRKAARLGAWQIVSRGRGAGKVEVVDSLRSIQQQRFAEPTVVIADRVMGDEEIPANVTAVIAPDVTDIVSHVAVRARNGNVLFASCHDPELLQKLKALRGHQLQLEISASGDVIVAELGAEAPAPPPSGVGARAALTPRKFTKYAVTLDEFNERIVGGKSCHQARLRGHLPESIRLPASVALPFGVFEKVLGSEANQQASRRYTKLVEQLLRAAAGAGSRSRDGNQTEVTKTLAALRETAASLSAPEAVRAQLQQAMTSAGLSWPSDWDKAWSRIKQVWASKWNERAFLSRQKLGLRHEDLFMAVLIQQVVPADYAFVVHTVNPSSGNTNELFGEVVLGLGETLVGNYPGRALSFVANKAEGHPTILSFPSKSSALYGGGLIFRSDSNGEDLAGYAGAGLYDSVLLDDAKHATVDYTEEPLVWDEPFRRNLLEAIARIGTEIEQVSGSPQDIEGAVADGQFSVVQTRPQV